MKTGSRRRLQQFGASRDAAGGAAGDYDATHYQAYHADTFSIDPWPFLGPFARRLQPGSRVLDIGCGSGRDLVWLRQQGFRVLGFERAPGLADLAGRLAGCDVIVGDFTVYDFTGLAVDALLMAGALVHIPPGDFSGMLARILPALKRWGRYSPEGNGNASGDGGEVYVSLKEGHGRYKDDCGRIFYLWTDGALRRLCEDLGLSVVHFRRRPSADGSPRIWLGYVLQPAVPKVPTHEPLEDRTGERVNCLPNPFAGDVP